MAYRSRHEGQVIDDAISAVIAKETVWDEKQDKITGSHGQLVGFNTDGTPVAQEAPDTGVVTFNGRKGDVSPADGDYTAKMVGADAAGSADKALEDAKAYVNKQIAAIPAPDVSGQIETHNSSAKAHVDIREAIPSKVSELENDSNYITVGDVDSRFAELIDAAPETMNTLDELSQALGDDPNFATTVANQIGTKAAAADLQAHINDKNNPHGFVESDPTVPSWAKAASKPTYSGSEISYDGSASGMDATNVQDAVDELFTSVSNGKATVASAITDKGVSTADDATFATMAANIGKIDTAVTPTITVDSEGLITASAGDKNATKQLSTQAAKTITPKASAQTAVASGRYTTGAVTVAGDANLISSNIKSGVSIFGVAGSMSSGNTYMATVAGSSSQTLSVTDANFYSYYNGGNCRLWCMADNEGLSYNSGAVFAVMYNPLAQSGWKSVFVNVISASGQLAYQMGTDSYVTLTVSSSGKLTLNIKAGGFYATKYHLFLTKL